MCNYELNSCKLFDTVPCLLRSKELNCKLFGYVPSLDHILSAFTAYKCTILHKQKQQLPTSWYCTMSVFFRMKCSNCKPTWWGTEIVLQSWTQQLQTFWHCTLNVVVRSLPIHGQVHTSKNNNCQPAGTVPCVFCSTRCKNCKAYGARMKLCCNYELNSCKLFDTVPCLLRSKELNCKLFGYVPSLTIF